ncbi:MFS general substrate transporter [Trichodelitschia bisporula]|uniref:MFS general substrate transporter n=1 Tax=Trichodelitschia bisporula TaxID=703511 RepID=A0A6G1I0H0_9PEZI|nr:MFS general substrate transporter [Trichodelitschia bisporula]
MKITSIIAWPYRKFQHPWQDHVRQFEYLDWDSQRKLAYQQIDKGGFGYWTVIVAGAGFMTDAYDIFAVNTVLPMLQIVYWNGNMPAANEVLINLSLLVGTFFGQLVFGVLADRYGRKRMYGIELLILIVANLFMALTSKGLLRSTNRLAWIAAWRFIMGIGIGADYPLSAGITAEFAPRRHRHRMLSALFFMQPIGALMANVVTVVAVSITRNMMPAGAGMYNCNDECAAAVDITWRWVVGLGMVPPALAISMRWWIPESPRYILEVEKDPDRAHQDIQAYYNPSPSILPNHSSPPEDEEAIRGGSVTESHTTSSPGQATLMFGEQNTLAFGEPVGMKDLQLPDAAIAPSSSSTAPPGNLVRKETWSEYWRGLWTFLRTDGNWTDLAGTSLTWMMLDFAFYFLSVNNPKILNKLWNTMPSKSVGDTLMENGYRAMIAVSIGALLGGAVFISMARYRWEIQLYGFWVLAANFVMVGVCFVVLLGTRYFAAVIVLYSISSFFFDFGPNTSTFVIAAEVFPTKYRCTCHGVSAAAGKLGSILAQIFLAYAKFGGLNVNAPHSQWLGWVLLIFTIWMVFGALITKVWVPRPVDIWGRSRSLEDLGRGKKHRQRIEKEEREIWMTFADSMGNRE